MKRLLICLMTLIFATGAAFAESVGYADFKKIENDYAYAKELYKQVDEKVSELQQYLLNKEREYKKIDSPISKKSFEERTEKEYKAKEETVLKFKAQKEDEVFENISEAAKIVASKKGVNVVLDYRVVLTGGVDITNDIINFLKTNPTPAKAKK